MTGDRLASASQQLAHVPALVSRVLGDGVSRSQAGKSGMISANGESDGAGCIPLLLMRIIWPIPFCFLVLFYGTAQRTEERPYKNANELGEPPDPGSRD